MVTPSELVQALELARVRPPRVLTLAVTGACNLACYHCWVAAGGASSPAHVPLPALLRVMEEFAAMGGSGVRITGGEPLCHPGWLDILRSARSLGFATVTLQTNAMLLKDTHLAALVELDFPGLTIQVSLDGAVAHSHDLVRGDGAFMSALQGIALLVQGGLSRRVSLFLSEMRHNLAEIPELLEFADSQGIGAVVSGAMVQCGRAAETPFVAPPREQQYLGLLERYDRDTRFRELYARIGSVAAVEWRAGDAVRRECCTFIENPYLTPSGRIYPCLLCHTEEFSVCGVFDKGLAAVLIEGLPLWKSLLRISRSRNREIPHCRDCPGKSSCAGGCMGRAWGSCADLMAADDRCAVRQAIYRVRR